MRVSTTRFTCAALEMSFLIAVVGLGRCAAAPAQFDPLPLGRTVDAPTGFLQFCRRRPDQCQRSTPVVEQDRPPGVDRPGLDAQAAGPAVLPGRPAGFRPSAEQDRTSFARAGAPAPDYSPNSFTAKPAAGAAGPGPEPSTRNGGGRRPHAHGPYSLAPEGAFGGRLRLSAGLAAEIGEVNVAINRAIKPRTDMEAFGVDNYWTLPLSDGPRAEGNCKHYALEKRRRLVDDGVPANALSLAIVVTSKNEVHAVLMVSTDQGDVVMDNLTDEVRPWRRTNYRWLARQAPGDPLHWVEVGRGS